MNSSRADSAGSGASLRLTARPHVFNSETEQQRKKKQQLLSLAPHPSEVRVAQTAPGGGARMTQLAATGCNLGNWLAGEARCP